MPSYKVKDRSPVTSQEVIVLNEAISYLKEKLKAVQLKCSHDFEEIEYSYYDDGYSQVDSEYENTLHCKICGHHEYGHKTGKIHRCY